MARFDLTEEERAAMEPALPTDVRGVERADDRRVLNGIVRRIRTASPWVDVPPCDGLTTTCYNRFVRLRECDDSLTLKVRAFGAEASSSTRWTDQVLRDAL